MKLHKRLKCPDDLHVTVESLGTRNQLAGPRSAVGNASGYRFEADCRSRGREFDSGPVPYFREN